MGISGESSVKKLRQLGQQLFTSWYESIFNTLITIIVILICNGWISAQYIVQEAKIIDSVSCHIHKYVSLVFLFFLLLVFLYSVHKSDKIPHNWMNMLWAFVVMQIAHISPIISLISPQEILKLWIFWRYSERERGRDRENAWHGVSYVFFSCLYYEYIGGKGCILLITVCLA